MGEIYSLITPSIHLSASKIQILFHEKKITISPACSTMLLENKCTSSPALRHAPASGC